MTAPANQSGHDLASLWMSSSFLADLIVLDDPLSMARHLCEQMREISGAKTVAFFLHDAAHKDNCKLMHVCPERRRGLFEAAGLARLCPVCHPDPIAFHVEQIPQHDPLRRPLDENGINNLLRLPISTGEQLFGSFVLADLPDPEHAPEIRSMIDFLAPTIGLAIQNCQTRKELEQQREHLEQLVEKRTIELEASNRELADSRRAALNMMEDSILAAKKLEFEHDLFTAFMDTLPAVVFFKDRDDRFVSVNKTMTELFNSPADDLIGKREADIFPPDQVPLKEEDNRTVMETGQIIEREERVLDDWFRTIKAPRYDEQGQVIGLYGIALNISAQKRAQNALQASETQYRSLFENLTTGFALHELITDDSGAPVDYRFLQVNPAFERLTGLRAEQIIGRTAQEFIPDLDPQWIQIYGKVAQTGDPIEFEKYSESLDKIFDIRAFSPAPNQFATVFSDITENKRAQEALLKSEEHLRTTLDSIGDAVISTDTNGLVSSINLVAQTLTGWSENDAIGQPIEAVLKLIDEETRHSLENPVASVLASGTPTSLPNHTLLIPRTGPEIPVADSCAPILSADGTTIGAVLVFRDQTEEYENRRALEKSEANLKKAQTLTKTGSWELDLLTGDLFWSDEVFHIFGVDPDQFEPTYEGFLEVIHPDDRQTVSAAYQNSLKNQTPYSIEHRVQMKDGSVKYVTEQCETIFDGNGHPCLSTGTVQDVTEKKEADLRLQQSNDLLRAIIDTVPARIFWKDLNSTYVGCNHSFAHDAGFDNPDDIIGKQDNDLLWGKSASSAYKALDQSVIASGEPILNREALRTDAEGITFWTEISQIPLTDAKGHPIGILGTYQDITERKRMQEAIEKRIVALTRPQDDASRKLTFEELFDLDEIQHIQDEFSNATGVAAIITAPDGTPITRPSNFCRLCCDIVKGTKTGLANCKKSDATLGRFNPDGPTIHTCLSCGLWDAGVSVQVGDQHIANWLVGQVRNETQTEEQIIAYARKIGADETEMLNAFREVPVMPKEQFKSVAHALYTLTNQISTSAYQNLQQARFIADQKKTENELRRLTTAIDQSPETVVITDTTATIQYVNPSFEKTTGYTRKEAIGQNPNILKSDVQNPTVYRQMWEMLTEGKTWEGQLTNKKKDGTLYTEEVSISPVRAPDGTITNYVAVKRDITEELARDEQMKQAQKMEAVGQLAGGIAHDFNNILQAILGFSELLQLSMSDSTEQQKTNVTEIQNAAKHAADLTRQLLVFSRKQPVSFAPNDLNSIVKNIQSFIESIIGESIRLQSHIQPKPLPIHGDARQLERAILNIVINARDAMPQGGTLTLETSHATFSKEYADANPKIHAGEFACLRIADSGVGMTQKVVEHIFEPFFSTKAPGKGTGLGLAAFYGIIQEHKGWVNVYSEPDQGTVFKIYLPLRNSSPMPAPQAERPNRLIQKVGAGQSILLVEDDPAIRSIADNVLSKSGYQVTTASSAEEAEQLFRSCDGNVALLVSDFILPKMNGGELAALLTDLKPDLPVIICSGYAGDRVNRINLERKGFTFLEKPYSIVNLLALVQKTLGKAD